MQYVQHLHRGDEEGITEPSRLLSVAVFLGGPIAWSAQFGLNYVLVPYACSSGHTWPLYASNIFFLLVVAACGVGGYLVWRRRAREADSVSGERTRFMALVGVLASAVFALLIIMQGVPVFIFDPCQT